MIYKTQKIQIEQHEAHYKPRVLIQVLWKGMQFLLHISLFP